MTRLRTSDPRRRAACGLAGLLMAATTAPAAVIFSPPGDGVSGNGQGDAPFARVGDTNGNRYQQIYSSSFFAGVGPQQLITDVAFRPKQGAFGTFIGSSLTISNLIVQLSTTARNADTDFPNGLSGDLALNPGPDATTVFSGPITLTTTRQLFDTGVGNFDFLITFQTPFLYQPGLGNLLLDVTIPAGATISSNGRNFPQLDTFTDGFPSRDGTASATDSNLLDGLTLGRNSTTGVVTRFSVTAIPEPATLAVFGGVALAGALGYRRRTKAMA
jgi:hypothetical protein